MSKTLLWLDDYRNPMEGQWLVFSPITTEDLEVHWVKSYEQFVGWVRKNGLPTAICFDHDLADEHYGLEQKTDLTHMEYYQRGDREMTGFDAAKWLIEYCMNNNQKLPLYNIQSANPVGKENIDKLLKNYLKNEK